jgi:hypothetical protein
VTYRAGGRYIAIIVLENTALIKIFGLRRVKRDSSAGCYNQDCVVCTGRVPGLVRTVQYQTFRCDPPCVSWLMASWVTGNWVRGGKLHVGEKSVRIRMADDWLWC